MEQDLQVIDTPGWFDTSLTNKEVEQEVLRCMAMCSPGPHAFLLIIKIDRFTDEQQQTVELIQKTFQENMANHTIIIFTHGDVLRGKPIEQFISEQDERVQGLVQQFGSRFMAFNNNDPKNQDQVTELLKKVDELLVQNEYRPFTNQQTKIIYQLLQVLEQNQGPLTDELIKKAKQEVRNEAQKRREDILKALEKDKQETLKLNIPGKISQILEELQKEQQSLSPDPNRLKLLTESLQKEKDNLTQSEEKEKKRMKKAEEELEKLDIWVQNEEQKREREVREKASNKSRWYNDPFYFKILMCLGVLMGGAGLGIVALKVIVSATAPAQLLGQLASLIGPEMVDILKAALKASVKSAGPMVASHCPMQ